MLNFKFTSLGRTFVFELRSCRSTGKLKGMKFLDKFTGVSRVEEEERETSRSVKRTEGRGSQVEILSAYSYVIIRERVQEIVMVLSTEPVDATTRQTQPRSPVI